MAVLTQYSCCANSGRLLCVGKGGALQRSDQYQQVTEILVPQTQNIIDMVNVHVVLIGLIK